MLSERATMLAVIRQNVLRAQQRMKKEDLQSRRPRLLAPPTVRVVLPGAGLAPEARLQVLRPLQDTGEDRYGRLEAPVAGLFSTIHPVFCVSLLKPAPPPSSRVYVNLPNPDIDLQVPEQVLQRRMHARGANTVPQMTSQQVVWP